MFSTVMPGGKAARADDLQPPRVLPHEDGTAQPVVTVRDGVEQCLAHGGFVEGGDVVAKQAVLIALAVVSQVDALPQRLVIQEKALAEFDPILRRARGFRGAVLEDDLRLRQVTTKRHARAEQDQRRDVQLAIHAQFGVGQQFLVIPLQDAGVGGPARPALPEISQCRLREISERRCGGFRRIIGACLRKHGAQFIWRYRHQIIAGPAQIAPAVLPGSARQPAGDMHDQHTLAGALRFLDRDAVTETLVESGLGASRFRESGGADYCAWPAVRDAENDLAAALVGKRNAVVHQFLEVKVV